MRIRRLDITGFKSFADRTVINFGNGVTGVVGPNGCGKSNVVDALRWVMGEQSAKHLRGGSMQDIIFNGSTIRGPQGMAEVSVTFENDGHLVPTEYAQYAEIMVTRRIYRDGDTDYEINSTPCRLRDIHDLFMGTGIGKRGFSIIEQGQVAVIIKSKPEDRRRIIEEAAGITKYKARRQAAERKMAATEQNLLRISDVIREVQRRLNSLKRQANKAERYKKLKNEVRDIELHKAVLEYFEHTNALGVERSSLSNHAEDTTGREAQIAALEIQAETARMGLLEEDKRLGAAQARAYELDNQVALLEQQVTHANRSVEDGDTRSEEQRAELNSLKEALEMILVQREELTMSAEELEQETLAKAEAQEMALVELNDITDRRLMEQKDIDALRSTVVNAATKLVSAETSLKSLAERTEEIAAQRGAHAVQREEASTAFVNASEAISAQEEALDAAREGRTAKEEAKQEAETALAMFKTQLDAADDKILSVKGELTESRSRLESLRAIERAFERSPEGVRGFLAAYGEDERVVGILADALVVPADLEVCVTAALAERLAAAVLTDENMLHEALGRLDDDQVRGTFVLADGAPKDKALSGATPLVDLLEFTGPHQGAVRAMLADVYVADDRDAPHLWGAARRAGVLLATRTGRVYHADGRAHGGPITEDDTGLLRQKRQIRELDAQSQTLDETLENLQIERAALTEQRLELEDRIDAAAEELTALSEALLEMTSSLNRQKDEVIRTERLIADLDAQKARLDELEVKLTAQREEAETQAEVALEAKTEAEDQLFRATESQTLLDREIQLASEKVTTIKVQVASAEERQQNLKQSLVHHAQNETDIVQRRTRLNENLEKYAAEREAHLQTEMDAQSKIGALIEERGTLKETLGEDREKYEAVAEEVRGLDAQVRELRSSLDAVRKREGAQRLRISELELGARSLEERCVSMYSVRPEEVLHDFHLRARPDYDIKQEVAERRRKMDGMGEINLTAIDEYNELEERYTFLRMQSDDLTHALEQLSKAILKINRTTKRRFKEAFEQINGQFEKVFPRLFKGGKAWLALTDPNDMLLTGVEIYAQPPGKKLQSVALMSGGEQALTAVSLIFAIFLIKPSPFCLLDEVDAPLDESNVKRFNELIKDVSNISQFIVITHNKRTMEAADQLYGITMEQPGVSKAVSVRMN